MWFQVGTALRCARLDHSLQSKWVNARYNGIGVSHACARPGGSHVSICACTVSRAYRSCPLHTHAHHYYINLFGGGQFRLKEAGIVNRP
jgi:hypothetical protein